MCIWFHLTVPGAPPQNLIAYSPSTGKVIAAWSPPPLQLQHGIITGYEVSFGIVESNITTNFTSESNVTRTGLLSNITYSITVAAVNGAGTSDNTTTLNFNLRELFHQISIHNCYSSCTCAYTYVCVHDMHMCLFYTLVCHYNDICVHVDK